MKKKKPSRHFFRVLGILFLIFIILYISIECGYYETKLSKKSALTEENIAKFEKDIKEGQVVDINSYIIEENIDYSNNITKAGTAISESVNAIMTEGLGSAINFLKKLFW